MLYKQVYAKVETRPESFPHASVNVYNHTQAHTYVHTYLFLTGICGCGGERDSSMLQRAGNPMEDHEKRCRCLPSPIPLSIVC